MSLGCDFLERQELLPDQAGSAGNVDMALPILFVWAMKETINSIGETRRLYGDVIPRFFNGMHWDTR